MNLAGAIRLFVCNAVWRTTRLRAAGRTLVRALGEEDGNLKTIAGMFLVRAGTRAEPLLEEALHRRESLPMVLSILASIGDKRFEPELREFSSDQDPKVAQAAREALRVLAAQH
jgi:HEAT repeat protein